MRVSEKGSQHESSGAMKSDTHRWGYDIYRSRPATSCLYLDTTYTGRKYGIIPHRMCSLINLYERDSFDRQSSHIT